MSEPRAPYGPPAQASPPNLAAELGPALERLGFAVELRQAPAISLLLAHWPEPGTGRVFGLSYTHYRPENGPFLSYLSLEVTQGRHTEPLLTDTHVRKLSDARRLLLNNCRYKAARLAALAAGTLQPASHQPTA